MHSRYARAFTEEVLRYASDSRRNPPSPLLADAFHKTTKQHFQTDYGKQLQCKQIIPSNLARQTNFMRLLDGLAVLENETGFRKIVEDNYRCYFAHYQHPNGLMAWGGHRLIDLQTLKPTGDLIHELKIDYPPYQRMASINKEATLQYLEAFWNAHVYCWETLEISRHGDYEEKIRPELWNKAFKKPAPFFKAAGLSFLNAGSDLIYAALEYYKLTGNEKAALWAKRLSKMYVDARHPETGLGVYQYTQAIARDHTENDALTTSNFGDRAKRQFGPELGEHALEGTILIRQKTSVLYGIHNLMLLYEVKTMSDIPMQDVLSDCVSGMEAFARYGYVEEENCFRPLLTDGRDLSGFVLQRDGYYGKKGTVLQRYEASGLYFLSFVKAALQSNSPLLWDTASKISRGLGFGCLNDLNITTASACPYCLFAFLNLYESEPRQEYLETAGQIARNIEQTLSDFAGASEEYVRTNRLEPFAVLCYEACKKGMLHKIDRTIYL